MCTEYWAKEINRAGCPSYMSHSYFTRYISIPKIIKLSQTIWELWPAQDFCFSGHNYIMNKVRVISLAGGMPTGPY